MVIDKWTRTSNNNSLSIPLLGHKSKETFSELKKEYERLQNLNGKYKNKYTNSSLPNNPQNNLNIIDFIEIKNYLDKINSIMLKVNELLAENKNYEKEKSPTSKLKDIKSITNDILLEYDIFLDNIKQIKNNKNVNLDSNCTNELNTLVNESQMIVNEINKKYKNDKNDEKDENDENNENIINIPQEPQPQPQEQKRYNNNDFNRNIDRGHINLFTGRREFNNSTTIVKRNYQFTVEEERLSNGIKLCLFFMILLFVLFIFYICIP